MSEFIRGFLYRITGLKPDHFKKQMMEKRNLQVTAFKTTHPQISSGVGSSSGQSSPKRDFLKQLKEEETKYITLEYNLMMSRFITGYNFLPSLFKSSGNDLNTSIENSYFTLPDYNDDPEGIEKHPKNKKGENLNDFS